MSENSMSPPDYLACAPNHTSPASSARHMVLYSKPRPLPNAQTSSRRPSSSKDYPHSKQSRHGLRPAHPSPNVDDRPHSQVLHGVLLTPSNPHKDMLAHGRREAAETHYSSQKKKGKPQRFYCDEYPPCSLSFTRSEHLARHIRKHTGERPFACHCSRRFSRLDNLRQHAQTVHQNENIPQDSLAAVGTRYQRQVPTERARLPANRPRGHTATSSHSGPTRRHTRNSWSTSSTSSMNSAFGAQGISDQRHPAPLVMPTSVDAIPCSPDWKSRPTTPATPHFNLASPHTHYHAPTSATTCNGPGTPPWTPATFSPHCMSYPPDANHPTHTYTHDRRLSFPNTSCSIPSPSAQPTLQSSATNQSVADAAFRRRTWHPDSSGALTSRAHESTPSNPHVHGESCQPSHLFQTDASLAPTLRLPGIESFDSLRDPQTPRHNSNTLMGLNPEMRLSWPISPSNVSPTRLARHAFSRRGPLHELQQDTRDWQVPRAGLGRSMSSRTKGTPQTPFLPKQLPCPRSLARVPLGHSINGKMPMLTNHATSWPTDSVQSMPTFPSWIRSVVETPLPPAEASGLAGKAPQDACSSTTGYYPNSHCTNDWTANYHGTAATLGHYGPSNPYPSLPTPEPCAKINPAPFPRQKSFGNTATHTPRHDALVAAASL